MKPKKRKERLEFILDEMAAGCTVYRNEDDDVGVCAFCQRLSYKDHQPGCPVQIAKNLIEERYG